MSVPCSLCVSEGVLEFRDFFEQGNGYVVQKRFCVHGVLLSRVVDLTHVFIDLTCDEDLGPCEVVDLEPVPKRTCHFGFGKFADVMSPGCRVITDVQGLPCIAYPCIPDGLRLDDPVWERFALGKSLWDILE